MALAVLSFPEPLSPKIHTSPTILATRKTSPRRVHIASDSPTDLMKSASPKGCIGMPAGSAGRSWSGAATTTSGRNASASPFSTSSAAS